MPRKQIAAIKNWIESMGFELVKSHILNSKYTRINYYNLGNFGIYEEISESKNKVDGNKRLKFISWNPWGDEFEVNSVKDLSKAYEDSLIVNPQLAVE
ncbi:hypothetical protein GZH53_04355 [Flavihumibacter sp. R14]|nr:hypothetical protein [Flavihumibacter soli]